MFLIILTVGILYVDYQNNSLLGEPKITIIDEFASEANKILNFIREK